MQAPKYIDRNIDNHRYRDMCNYDHHKKLVELSKAQDVRAISKSQTQQLKKIKNLRDQVKKFDMAEKNVHINKDNQKLLSKLIEISSGKWSSIVLPPKKKRTKNRTLSQLGNSQVVNGSVMYCAHQSLNFGVRK